MSARFLAAGRLRSTRVGHPLSAVSRFGPERLEDRVVPSGAQDITGLTALRADPNFASVDGALPGQPHNVGVAILDTGMFGNHPDLRGNFKAFYDAVANSNINGPVVTDVTQMTSARDPNGHGSHVAGTIGSTNPAIGVAPRVDLIGVRALPAAGENPRHDTLVNALNWVAANQQRFNIRVVNMSLGRPSNVNDSASVAAAAANAEAQAIRRLEGLGVTVVTASGNSFAQYDVPGSATPGAFSTITVANTWEDNGVGDSLPSFGGGQGDNFYAGDRVARGDRFAASSQRSGLPNQVAAPGTTIYSVWNGAPDQNGRPKLYSTISGTSMATPFVSGTVALMQDAAFTAAGRYLSPADVLRILRASADAIVDAPNADNFRQNATTRAQTDLPETGLTFQRVNVQRAVAQSKSAVGGGTVGGGGGGVGGGGAAAGTDNNKTRDTAVTVPSVDGNRIFRFTGSVGTDGKTVVGANDVDVFKVTVASRGTLLAVTDQPPDGVAFDSYLRIFNAAGVEIAANDDFGTGKYSTAGVAVTPGTYYVGVSSFNNLAYNIVSGTGASGGRSTGDYLLGVQLNNPDPNGVFTGAVDFPTAAFITSVFDDSFHAFDDAASGVTGKAGYLVAGTIGSDPPPADDTAGPRVQIGPGDVDMYRYVAPDDGRAYVRIASGGRLFNPFGAPLGTGDFLPFDTYLRVLDADGNQVAANDDITPQNTDSQIVLNGLTRGQVLYFAVSNFTNSGYDPANPVGRPGGGNGGYYELFSTFDNGDLNGTAYNAVELPAIGTPAGGTIGTDFNGPRIGATGSLDTDFLRVTAPSDGILRVTTLGENGFQPSVSIWGFQFDQSKNVTGLTKIATSERNRAATMVRVAAGVTYFILTTGQGNSGFNWYDTASGTGGQTGKYSLTTELLPAGDSKQVLDRGVRNGAPPRIITLGSGAEGDIGTDSATDGTEYVVDVAAASGIQYGQGDLDTYAFVATATGHVRFFATGSTELGGGADPVLRVFDAQGNELAFNDDATDSTRDAVIDLNVVAGVTYYVGVTGYSPDAGRYNILTGDGPAALATASVGGYTLTVTDITPVVVVPPVNPPVTPPVTVPPVIPPVTPTARPVLVGGLPDGSAILLNPANGQYTTGPSQSFFAGATARTLSIDITGDGVPELVAGAGPGSRSVVRVFDGATGRELVSFTVFEDSFIGGVFLAGADLTGDGKADLVVCPDLSGGPVAAVYDGARLAQGVGGEAAQLFRFFAIDDPSFRGGARPALGDVTGDGVPDLLVSAGFGGGPRVTFWDGDSVRRRSPVSVANFFAFEDSLRNGTTIAAGDLAGDGRAEVAFGAGPGGGPRVRIFLPGPLLAGGFRDLDGIVGSGNQLANFYAGSSDSRGGVRLAMKDIDADGRADLVSGSGQNEPAVVRVFKAQNLRANSSPNPDQELFLFGGQTLGDGVFVG